ncbi:MAG: hypothetical protein DMG07_16775 [Acidobacteria bacterium]|nr:MAG: hypothetical protein DMG07_16775 [Acidobacteriota bacterium]
MSQEERRSLWAELRARFSEPRTQPSLFHYIVEDRREGAPSVKELIGDLFTGLDGPLFIPSVFADPQALAFERERFRARRLRAGTASFALHLALLGAALFLLIPRARPLPVPDGIVFVSPPFYSPFEGTGPDGGGGGGGGKRQKTPASGGRMPDTTRVQFTAPDPQEPLPLVPAEDLLASSASVQMPIDIPQDQSLPVGDVSAPPSDRRSSGPGAGGGIGTGVGTGLGPGTGPGVGPGSDGGMGGGRGGGIGPGQGPFVVGDGVRPPTPLSQPLPMYTEEARKARVEGIVQIQAVVRRDGSVDSFKVTRGLGHGLDESAIKTIAARWRFRPGTRNGQPVDVVANIEVSFRLY